MAPPRVLPPSKNRVDIPRITRTGDTLGRQRRGYYRISAQKSMAMDIGVIICTLQNPLINEEMTDLGLGQETSARLPGVSSAPPTPWRIRATTSTSMLGAAPQSADAAANQTVPITNALRRPRWSPSAPPSKISEARESK